MTNEELLRQLREMVAERDNHAKVCPGCGRCPTCGRSAAPYYPYWPTWPYWTQPYWHPYTITWGNDGTAVTSGTLKITNNEGNSGGSDWVAYGDTNAWSTPT